MRVDLVSAWLGAIFVTGVFGQEKVDDPFDPSIIEAQAAVDAAPDTWEVTCEVFSLPFHEAAELRREHKESAKVYEELVRRVDAKEAILEEWILAKCQVGSTTTATAVEEYIHPNEFDPPETPNQVGSGILEQHTSGLRTPSNPTAYETRNVGTTFEMQFLHKVSPDTIALDLTIERVSLAGHDVWGKEIAEASVPRFEVQGFNKSLTLSAGKVSLAGTMSPPKPQDAEQRRVWFAFVKSSPVHLESENKDPGKEGKMKDGNLPWKWDLNLEVFSLPLSEAARLARLNHGDEKIHAQLVKGGQGGEVRLEEFAMLRTKGRGLDLVKEVTEMIYATEYDPPDLPNQVENLTNRPEVAKGLITPASPTAFDSREVGSIFEAALFSPDGTEMVLNLNLEYVRFLGRNSWGQGPSLAEMPRFTNQRLVSQIKLDPEVPVLVGSISPPAPLQPQEGEKRVWLAYATPTEARE